MSFSNQTILFDKRKDRSLKIMLIDGIESIYVHPSIFSESIIRVSRHLMLSVYVLKE